MRNHIPSGRALPAMLGAAFFLLVPTSAWAASDVSALAGSQRHAEEGTSLRMYGFIDVGLKHLIPRSDKGFMSGIVDTRSLSFVDGQINLYADVQHAARWRALTEVRLTNLPHGVETGYASPVGTDYERTSTRVYDASSPTGYNMLALGSIVMERLWIEWQGYDWLKVRVGYWLTPYGIWNVDHGTPALIAIVMPGFFAAEDIPTHQLGLQMRGSYYVRGCELDYVAYVSNGRTEGLVDYTNDKAMGGRLVLRRSASTDIALGVSAYYDRNADVSKEIVSFSPFRIGVEQSVAARDRAVGFDLSIDSERLRFRAEMLLHDLTFEEGKRLPSPGGAPGYQPDQAIADGYLLGAYAFVVGSTRIEPYVYGEGRKTRLPTPAGGALTLLLGAGVNVYFTSQAQWKTQIVYNPYFDVEDGMRHLRREDLTALASRLVLAF